MDYLYLRLTTRFPFMVLLVRGINPLAFKEANIVNPMDFPLRHLLRYFLFLLVALYPPWSNGPPHPHPPPIIACWLLLPPHPQLPPLFPPLA